MLQITPIPAFQDNYLWLIENETETWIVDPGDAEPVLEVLAARNKKLTGILITHHHHDHIGGVERLLSSGLKVIGPKKDQFELVNDPVHEGDSRRICGVEFRVMEVPGHTLNHIAYYAEPLDQPPVLFCGDTLFSAGCGRLFEGTPKQMYQSLDRFMQLTENTLVYCAHEYTQTNLRFAMSVEPGNRNISLHMEKVAAMRAEGIPSIPTDMKKEKAINPFLRTASDEIISNTMTRATADDYPGQVEVFAILRKMKDQF
jgi:hydroxyacylglutathione hydrolase